MTIMRLVNGRDLRFELTEEEEYATYDEVCRKLMIVDIKVFISKELCISDVSVLTTSDYETMAVNVISFRNKGYSDTYSLASVIIPYLRNKGIDVKFSEVEFIDK